MRLLLPLILVGCGPRDLTVATYNAGLAVGFVPAAEERAPEVADAVGAVDADVICLQEVWLPEHVALFEDAAAAAFPDTYFPASSQETSSEPACEEEDIGRLIECIDDNCEGVCSDELITCVERSCTLPFLGLEDDCMACVQATIGGDPAEVHATCTTGSVSYAYDGSFGTGLLSRLPIASVEEHVLESTTNRRSILHATVEAPGGDVDVYCTHLTAVFSLIPYPRPTGSWAEEQRAQVAELMDLVGAAPTGRAVLAGDLNTGPAVGDSIAEQPESWTLIEAAGMRNPYVEAEGPCTFCPTNPLIGADSDEEGVVIDHLLLGGLDGEATAERILDEAIETESCGEAIEGAYSDHYGVRLTVQR